MTTVLLVEDDQHQRLLYEMELEAEGYHVVSATDGHEGLAKMATCAADVVVMDICLRDMDGVEVMRRMRSIRPGLPIVVNTAYGRYREESHTVSLGRLMCVVKSSDLRGLKESIKQVLQLPSRDERVTNGKP